MTIQTVYADAHITGNFANPDNAVGNTPLTWAGQLNVNSNYTSRWSLADLTPDLTTGATQTIRILARKGTNSGTPTITINLYENGSLVAEILASTNITSIVGQTLVATFLSSQITNKNNVEIEVVQTSAGGSPSVRNSAQIAYIQWDADVDTSQKHTGGGSGGSVTVSGAGSGKKQTSGSSSGSITVSGSGQGGVYKQASGGSGGAITVSGAGSGRKRILGSSSGSLVVQGAGAGVGISPLVGLVKQVKRGGVLVPMQIRKKVGGVLTQIEGKTR
jgi:hypothetical protein